ncbi:trans-aconitate methyltransferase 1 [Parahypoxylon ruwenzoriense]
MSNIFQRLNGRRGNSAPVGSSNKTPDQIEDELRAHFAIQYPRFAFQGLLGRGAFGLTFCVVEKLSANRSRRLAVKRSVQPRGEDDLRNEIEWLQTLRGAEHIVRILGHRDEPAQRTGLRHNRRNLTRRSRIQDALEGLTGPVVVLEYLENGHLERLYRRLIQYDQLLPNRILWSFFLCLIRACVALAYPLNGTDDQPNRLETVPADGRAPSMIEHADLHHANIMIGNPGNGFREHDLVPPLKFIDFGRARKGFQGVSDNIMINLIARHDVRISRWITTYRGFRTKATEILHHGNGRKYPTLDDDLRDFLARCLADEERDRPSLSTMLRVAENAVRTKTAAAFPGNSGETDRAIRNFLQKFIYDADNS